MARKPPYLDVLRALFARSGNQCAYPGCKQNLISNNNKFIGQVCHIEAANIGGERYNPEQTDEERRSYDNLVLMCYPHHIETNDVLVYTVSILKDLKYKHERKYLNDNFKIDESLIYALSLEFSKYWSEIEFLNTKKHVCKEMSIEVNANASFFEIQKEIHSLYFDLENICHHFEKSDDNLMSDLLSLMQKLKYDTNLIEQIPYYENPFINRSWEMRNIGQKNIFLKINIKLVHLEIKYIEQYLKTNSDDATIKNRLKYLMKEFNLLSKSSVYYD